MLTRRDLFIGSAAVGATALIFPTTGCSSATIADLVQTLGNSASQIAALEGNTSLASKLLTDTGAAVTAIDSWKTGTPSAEVIEGLNIVEDDLQLFPITDQYLPLIDLAIATAESVIALLPPSTTNAVSAKPRRHVQLGYAAPKTRKDYVKKYNAIVAQHPDWKVSKIVN